VTHYVVNCVIVKLFIIRGARLVKLLTMYNDIVTVCSQSIHSVRFHWRLSTDTRWVMCLYKWPRTLHSCGWSLYDWQTTRKRKPGLRLVLCLCERTLIAGAIKAKVAIWTKTSSVPEGGGTERPRAFFSLFPGMWRVYLTIMIIIIIR